MPIETVTVEAPTRLDHIVARFAEVGSRSRARAAIESGKVSVDGAEANVADSGRQVEAGSVISLNMSRPGSSHNHVKARRSMVEAGLSIVFEDDELIALDKPPGLLTDTATAEQRREKRSLREAVERYLKPKGFHARIVHRIDRDTSGIVLVAKTEAAETSLKAQFEARTPIRLYRAFVRGADVPDSAVWADWMRWDAGKRIQMVATPEAEGAVLAQAQMRVVERFATASAIEVKLETGRRNQIRLHAALRGHALLGERLYDRTGWLPEGVRLDRQALHAISLTVRHPTTRAPITFTAPLPADLAGLERALRRGTLHPSPPEAQGAANATPRTDRGPRSPRNPRKDRK